jgi:hypothetical protein
VAQVSSVDHRQDLVVDAPVENEGNGWASSGANPWHLDNQTESILFLTDESDKPARIGFSITAGGIPFYLTSLKLHPHETRAINLRKLRDAQLQDFKKHRIPAGATDGSVNWIRLDNVAVGGRVMVINRSRGVASSYHCFICRCPPDYGTGDALTPTALDVEPSSVTLVAGGNSVLFEAEARYQDCNDLSYYWTDVAWGADWESSNHSVVTVSSLGEGTPVGGGTATVTASYTDCGLYWYDDQSGFCWCHNPTTDRGSASVSVAAITAPDDKVWWFNGQTPSGYATTITLTALPSGASYYGWYIVAGTDKAYLTGQSGNTIQLRGNDLSASLQDVTVNCEVQTSSGDVIVGKSFTVRGPYKLAPGIVTTIEEPGYGYLSDVYYTIYDNLNSTMPSDVPYTEEWVSNPENEDNLEPNCTGGVANWTLFVPQPQGGERPNSQLVDEISGPGVNNNPAPCPTPTFSQSLNGPLIVRWQQRWRVGTMTSGLGAPVQLDWFERFLDRGGHVVIASPD